MTERLYYDDAYCVKFSAQVAQRLAVENRPAVVLDRTCFYPTGGGQPFDIGMLDASAVVDVFTRDEDSAVVHVLDGEVVKDEVICQIDWARRFDHMQHHTGQHILTQAFVQVANASTVSFHLSRDSVTIDLDVATIELDTLLQVEQLANQVVWENRPVTARLIDPDSAAGVRIRKIPEKLHTQGLRVIDVQDFDLTACGGTHVAHTAEIGMIKVVRLERRGDKTRVEFRCGGRALRDYQDKNSIINQLTAQLTCSAPEIPDAVKRLQDDARQLQRGLKDANSQLMDYEVESLLSRAADRNGVRVVKAAFEGRDAGDLRILANKLIQLPDVVALLGTSGEKAQLAFARSENVSHAMNALLAKALETLGGRGGGQAGFAQGGGIAATQAQVQAALDAAEMVLLGEG
jgi:alanyl-tRNA synthetase